MYRMWYCFDTQDSIYWADLEPDPERGVLVTNLIPIESARMEMMEEVSTLKLQGYTETQISKQLNIKRREVLELIDEWKFGLQNDPEARGRAKDALYAMDKHYDLLLRKYWEYIKELEDQIDMNGVTAPLVAQKMTALKGIADTEAKRLDALTKAGLLDDKDLADELAEMERKQGILVDILRDGLCKNCRAAVAEQLQRVTNKVEIVEIVD